MAECILHVDMLNDEPFLSLIQLALDVAQAAERLAAECPMAEAAGPTAEALRCFREWFE